MDTRRYEWTHKTKWMPEETEMEPIELSRREPSPENPRQMQYAGQRTAQEVFEELKHRLEGMPYTTDT